jgi:hypothetical protein
MRLIPRTADDYRNHATPPATRLADLGPRVLAPLVLATLPPHARVRQPPPLPIVPCLSPTPITSRRLAISWS